MAKPDPGTDVTIAGRGTPARCKNCGTRFSTASVHWQPSNGGWAHDCRAEAQELAERERMKRA